MKRLREIRGLSAQDLADRCSELGAPQLSRGVISNIESRKENVSIEEVLVLASALDVSPVQLFTPADDEQIVHESNNAKLIEEARAKRDRARRRALVAEESYKLWKDEVDAAKGRLPKLANSEHHVYLLEAAKKAERRLEQAREELVDARVDLAEARDELEALTEPLSMRITRIASESITRLTRGER